VIDLRELGAFVAKFRIATAAAPQASFACPIVFFVRPTRLDHSAPAGLNPPMKRLLLLPALLLPSLLQAAQSAQLIAYWVKPEQVEAAADMTLEDCRQKLTVLWTESVELSLNTSAKVAHEADGRSAKLQIDTAAAPGLTGWRLNLLWAEVVKPDTGPERRRSLNTVVTLQPGAAMIVARNLSQAMTTVDKSRGTRAGYGIVYVLALETAK
jgi:hypothetical protein